MEKISELLSIWLIMKKYGLETDKNKLQFAIEVVLNNLLSFLVIIILGILINEIIITIVYIFIFVMFRSLRDRYHATTFVNCFILTLGCYFLCILFFLVSKNYNYVFISKIFLILNISIFIIREFQNKANFKVCDLFYFIFLIYHLICWILLINNYQIGLYLLLIGFVIAYTNKSIVEETISINTK